MAKKKKVIPLWDREPEEWEKRMTVRRWYRGVWIPAMGTHYFHHFVASCVGIIRSVMQERMKESITVRFGDVDTAAANFDTRTIYINKRYLTGHFGDGTEFLHEGDFTIAAICGIVVHETAHFAYSRSTLKPYMEYIKANTKVAYSETLAAGIGNMIEDIFIEAEVDRLIPNLTWMLGYCQEAVFNEELKKNSLELSKLIFQAPSEIQEVSKVFNVIVQHRHQAKLDSTPYISNLFALAKTAEEAYTYEERDELALAVYEGMARNLKLRNDEQESPLEGATFKFNMCEEASGQLSKNDPAPEIGLGDDRDTTDANNQMMEAETRRVTVEQDDRDPAQQIFYIEERCRTEDTKVLEPDKRYFELARVARQRATVNRPYGEDRERGTNIRRLWRIATDSKIFADPLPSRTYKPMQVLILCDGSGSMRIGRLLEPALKATLGAADALSQAKCEVAVYTHTADVDSGHTVNFYRLKGFQEPVFNMPERATWVNENGRTSENRDGYAIQHLAKKLTNTQKSRLMIVISDGYPNAHQGGYVGQPAINHTKASVEKVRRQGIEVLSISITPGAMNANNEIYGKGNNLCNTDPNCISEIVQRLIMR